MASATGAGDAAAASSRKRWSDSKVYTRKSHATKNRKPPSDDEPPPRPPSDDASSSLTPNGHRRTVIIPIASRSRSLRRQLAAELDQVRALSHKLDLSLSSSYTQSQLSVTTDRPIPTPNPNPKSKRGPVSHRRPPLTVSVVDDHNNNNTDSKQQVKRTPKANQYYRNSDFFLAKDKLLPPAATGSHKKHKKHAPSADAIDSTDKKLYAQAFRNCAALLAKLMKHKFGWVFNKPVDVKGLGLHDYLTIIKQPMDLGTVKQRLGGNWYKSPGEFAEDVRLTFQNGMTYNSPGQDVYVMAEQLSQAFEEGWPAIEAEYTYLSQPPLLPKKQHQQQPQSQPQMDARTLERSDSTAHPVRSETKTRHTTHVSRPHGMRKPKARELHKRDMTFDEKQKLSSNLQNLPSEKLDNVVQIIKKRNMMLSQHDNEIEVDIDNVDNETLWELDRFVTNYKKSLSKNKKKAELAMARANAEQNARDKAPDSIQKPDAAEVHKESNTVREEKEVASTSPAGKGKEENHASRSSNSSSSSSDSGSSSSDSDSESSSAYGSDAPAHSPKT